MLITWCRQCLGIALPYITGAKSRVRWQCPFCAPSGQRLEGGRVTNIRYFVEVIEEPVTPGLYHLWAAHQHGLELSVMARDPVPYGRTEFWREAEVEVPPLPVPSEVGP